MRRRSQTTARERFSILARAAVCPRCLWPAGQPGWCDHGRLWPSSPATEVTVAWPPEVNGLRRRTGPGNAGPNSNRGVCVRPAAALPPARPQSRSRSAAGNACSAPCREDGSSDRDASGTRVSATQRPTRSRASCTNVGCRHDGGCLSPRRPPVWERRCSAGGTARCGRVMTRTISQRELRNDRGAIMCALDRGEVLATAAQVDARRFRDGSDAALDQTVGPRA